MQSFGTNYARYYDIFYSNKDYKSECDFLENLFLRYSEKRVQTVLDLGCGTGGHVLELARRGYKLVGIDISEGMIEVARQKQKMYNLQAEFYLSPMQNFSLDCKFDAVICMFNAINYVVNEDDLERTFKNVYEHLNKNGLFIFDFRNGIPSLREYSPLRISWFKKDDLRILRISENQIEAMEQLFFTTYTCLVFKDQMLIEEIKDKHIVRFMFPREVRFMLKKTGFEVLFMSRFLEPNKAADEHEWNIVVIARAT